MVSYTIQTKWEKLYKSSQENENGIRAIQYFYMIAEKFSYMRSLITSISSDLER